MKDISRQSKNKDIMKKLSQYAKENNITYRTAFTHFHKGLIEGAYQLPSGTIVIPDSCQMKRKIQIAIYARVSSSENKNNLESQAKRLEDYAAAKGYKIYKTIKEIGSGVNDKRPMLEKLFKDDNYNIILIEHKDRLIRFGFNYINVLLEKQGKTIEVINDNKEIKEDLMEDFVSIITSFCARIYGYRRNKRRTEKLIEELKNVPN